MTKQNRLKFNATIHWQDLLTRYVQMTLGIFLGALAVVVFMTPVNVTPTGVTGISVLLNEHLGTPIGIMIVILNIPIQIVAARALPGGWRSVATTAFIVITYALMLDILVPILPTEGVSDDVLLNAIFGGVLGGVSSGLVFRSGGTFGGTSTLAVMVQRRTGIPMSSTFLYLDMVVVGAAGLTFGWEPALYATLALFISGVATDYVLEGPSVVRTAVIITKRPQDVADVIMRQLQRGATGWQAQGMYTGQEYTVVYVTMARSEVRELRTMVLEADPDAFVVIGQGHVAYGAGFKQVKSKGNGHKNEESRLPRNGG